MKTVRARVLASTFLAGTILLAGSAHAQAQSATTDANAAPAAADAAAPAAADVAAPAQPAPASKEIVITGSRIPQPNLTAASPVTVLSSQDIKLQGTTRTEDLINSLPQSFAAQGSNVSNGASGTATVNLRGLEAKRTLVLVNGRRLQPGDPRQGAVADINFIPSALVKRVDVLTGGASSVYGADAVAGVVNFIMDTNFRGLRLDAQASTFMHYNNASDAILNGDVVRGFRPPHGKSINGGAQDISASFGAQFDDGRGSILAYATYRKQDPVLQASRDYSFCSLAARATRNSKAATDPAGTERDFNCGGSSTAAAASVFLRNFANPHHVQGNQLLPGTVPFNFGPYNYYQRPDERYTLGAFAEYEISPGAKPYLEAMFMDDKSDAQIAPSGDFLGNTKFINCDNPLLSAQQLSIICAPANTEVDSFGITRGIAYVGRRNVEGGGRDDNLEHIAWRVVGGIKGDLLKGLSYDTSYQFGTTRLTQVYKNDFSITRINRALDVVADPVTGQPVCRSKLQGIDPNCVPWNIWQTGGVTQAALDYLQVPGLLRGEANEIVANANFTLEGSEYGLQTPWSDRGIGINVGGEYRKESLDVLPDISFQTGDLAGQGAPTLPVSGKYDVRELFTEIQIPIVSHSFIEEFTLGAGYRYSDYKVAGGHFSTDTYKIEVELAPIRDIKTRASYNRAVRAPNVVELFTNSFVGLGGTSDPCSGPAINLGSGFRTNGTSTGPTTAAAYASALNASQCANTGVTAAQFGLVANNPANQYNALFGGNTSLSPETADTYTAGLVLQPRWIPGLALSADYFDISIKELIGVLPFQQILSNCATTGNALTCGLIHRQSGSGVLWGPNTAFVVTTNINVGGLRTKGIDLNGSYSHRLGGLGTLSASLVGTWLKDLVTDTGLGTKYDCAGFFGTTCGTPSPVWRHKFRLGFTLRNGLGVSAQWRYFSKVRLDVYNPDIGGSSAGPADDQIKAQSYFDLSLSARVADKLNFRLGANNLLDKEPPIVGGEVANAPYGNGNTYPQVYDALGRFLFAGVTVDF